VTVRHQVQLVAALAFDDLEWARAHRHPVELGVAQAEAAVLVRRQDRSPAMKGCIRITVGSRAENDALTEAARGMR
jgi:histidinol-phosphate/aromatic aminotransferase/cobyric acid decarboxylase-like protein